MKLLAFSDVHMRGQCIEAISKKAAESKPDYLVCAGDLSIFEEELQPMIDRLARLKIPIIAIHGNHEGEHPFQKALGKAGKSVWLHKRAVDIDGVLFIGYGGGGFSQIEPGFDEWARTIERRLEGFDKAVLVTHAPPYKTALDEIAPGCNAGVKSFRSWIMRHNAQVKLAICGHIHETAGREDHIGRTRVVNPGPKGKIINL